MAIEIRCPSCNTVIEVPDKNLEGIKSCPKCGQRVELPGRGQADRGPEKPIGPSSGAGVAVPLTVVKPRRSRMASWSLLIGVLSLPLGLVAAEGGHPFASLFGGVPAIILGVLALRAIIRSRGALTGKGMAVAAICMGVVSVWWLKYGIDLESRSLIGMYQTAAVGSLKTIASSQALFKDARKVDQNGNGIGEYGLLGELCGELALRPAGTSPVSPPFISQEFRIHLPSIHGSQQGRSPATKSYMFKIYLSNATATDPTLTGSDKELGGSATKGGPKASDGAIKLQESHFVVYAWPREVNETGRRAFFVNEWGQVYATKMETRKYSGANSPSAEAAFIGPVFSGKLSSHGTPGNDTNVWNPIGW